MSDFILTAPANATALDSNTVFAYQEIADTTDIKGNPVQIYANAANITQQQVTQELVKLNNQFSTLQNKITSMSAVAAQINTQVAASQAAIVAQSPQNVIPVDDSTIVQG